MIIKDKAIVRAVNAMNLLTKSDELRWTTANVPKDWYVDNADETIINPVYDTTYDGRHLRLFKYTHRYYVDEETYTMASTVKLSFIDALGRITWEFPTDRLIHDLYDTVRYKTAGVEDFFKKFSGGDDEKPLF